LESLKRDVRTLRPCCICANLVELASPAMVVRDDPASVFVPAVLLFLRFFLLLLLLLRAEARCQIHTDSNDNSARQTDTIIIVIVADSCACSVLLRACGVQLPPLCRLQLVGACLLARYTRKIICCCCCLACCCWLLAAGCCSSVSARDESATGSVYYSYTRQNRDENYKQ
jgi:hypothetical protein